MQRASDVQLELAYISVRSQAGLADRVEWS